MESFPFAFAFAFVWLAAQEHLKTTAALAKELERNKRMRVERDTLASEVVELYRVMAVER